MGTDKGEGAAHGGDLSYDGVVSSLGHNEPVPVTSEMINSLPEPVRRLIHDLETRCDPAGDIQTIASLTEQRAGLLLQVKELQAQVEQWQQNAVQSSVAAGQLGAQALELDHEVKRLRREFAAWRTLARGYTDVPGMQDDIEEDGEAILRLKLERLELVNLRFAAIDAFTRPYFITATNPTVDPPLGDKVRALLGLSAVGSRPLTLTPARVHRSSNHEGEVLGTPLPPMALERLGRQGGPAPRSASRWMGAPKHADPWAGSLVVRATMALDAKTGEMVAVEGGPQGKRG